LGAGYETTVTSLGWILYELATHPDEQRQLREEIYNARGADDTGTVNFDALPFLNAVIKVNLLASTAEFSGWKYDSDVKETVRFDTVVPHLFRVSTRDEVIPLSEQVHCRSGSVIEELYIPRGTHVIISDIAYNRLSCQKTRYVL
jgi:cytochrome P450